MPQISCDLRQTRAYAALLIHRFFLSPIAFIVYGVVALFLLLDASAHDDRAVVYLCIAVLLFGLHVVSLFVREKLENDEQPVLNARNIACSLSFDVQRRIRGKGKLMSIHLFRAAVYASHSSFVLHMLGMRRKDFFDRCIGTLPILDTVEFLVDAQENAKRLFGSHNISGPVLLFTFFQHGGVFNDILRVADLSLADIEDVVRWEQRQRAMQQRESAPQHLIRSFGSLGRSWIQGYTNDLDRITDDISTSVLWRAKQRGVMIHAQELESAVHVLSRAGQKNMLLIGPQGTGKRTMLENIAAKLRTEELQHGRGLTRVLVLKSEQLLSGYRYPDRLLLRALERAERSGKFLLLIQNLSLFLQAADPNIRTVLAKFLQSKKISVLAITTPDEYHRDIRHNAWLDAAFEKLYVNNATESETLSTVMQRSFLLLQQYRGKVHITYRTVKLLLRLTARYVSGDGLPGAALAVLDDAFLSARNDRVLYVQESHIRKAVSLKAHMDVAEISDAERQNLLDLEQKLHEKVVGQDAAITSVVHALKRARLDINAGKRPIGTFLFLGPTGVGKTHTAKVLAQEYFGKSDALIRIDMNEYGTEDSVYGIIGDPNPSVAGNAYLSRRVQDHPFSLLLLDEIEKAHPKVLNVFLQILDEGQFVDNRGVKTDFRNCIIIATSNAGALFIRNFVQQHGSEDRDTFKRSLIDTILKDRTFSPEFMNRFDDVILYYPMTVKDAITVALLMLQDIVREVEERKGCNLILEQDVVAAIVKKGYSVEFGARELRRVIVDVVENYLADYLLTHTVQRGDTVRVELSTIRKYLPGD